MARRATDVTNQPKEALTADDTKMGSRSVDINQASLSNDLTSITGAADLATLAISAIKGGIKAVATLRAENGAQSNRLSFASDLL